MTDLSPAAQAVYDAFWDGIRYKDDITDSNIAAALRALADRIKNADLIRQDVIDIANELEKQAYEL
jgi:hypothetical protein